MNGAELLKLYFRKVNECLSDVLHPSSEQEGIASEEMRYYHYREFRMQFNKLMNHDHHERRDMKVGISWDYKEFLYPLDL